MNINNTAKQNLLQDGFAIIENVFTPNEIETLLQIVKDADGKNANFRKNEDLFAIRQFFKEVPEAVSIVLNTRLRNVIAALVGNDYFIIKSIYFDKPGGSNWFVAWHQDLMISVTQKAALPGYIHWSGKQGYTAVLPPVETLEHTLTIRIHLDDTDEHNGALYVMPGSHTQGVYRPDTIDWSVETEVCCPVPAGGVMLMRPLLLHSSRRTTNDKNRRVIHIELSNKELPAPVDWHERQAL